uniref:hypothetical protein n=1 Tax=Pleionea sediminis TaxID=2569479 RepID=UPI00197C0004
MSLLASNQYTFEIIGKDKTGKALGKVKRNLDGVVDKSGKAAAALAAGFAVGGAAIVRSTLQANTEMLRLADGLNMSSEAMSEWSYAASTVNISSDKMADIFKDVNEKIGD